MITDPKTLWNSKLKTLAAFQVYVTVIISFSFVRAQV